DALRVTGRGMNFSFNTPDMKIVLLADAPEEGVSHNPEITKQVLLRRGDLPHLTSLSRSRLLPGQTARAHAHDRMHEVFFVESGAGLMRVGDQEVALGAGTCVAVEPGESHEIANTGANDLVLIYFGIEE
ncbi:MAG: cupin domain-containing protein, partial [Pyrinomonadaceae bacterium]